MQWLKDRPSSAKNWFGEKWKAILIGVCIVAFVAFIVWKVPEWQVRAYHGRLDANAISKLAPQELIQLQKDLITAENNARVTLAQIIGGLVVLLGLYATFKNVRVAQDNLRVTEEGKLTERFSKAVELLGSKELGIRLGGIYALERIARDSQKDHWTVMEVLTAFVREQSRAEYEKTEPRTTNDQESEDPNSDKPKIRPREDIQAALTVIGRRKWVEQETLGQAIDLSNAFLKGASLSKANLSKASLYNADLSEATLDDAKLYGANLNSAKFYGAKLYGANLTVANIRGANLSGANLSKAILHGANLSRANLNWANLSEADLRGAKLIKANLKLANLRGADLSEADHSGADLKRADLRGANFIRGKLINAKLIKEGLIVPDIIWAGLRDVIGLTWEQIAVAIIDETTKLPPELEERRKAEQGKKAAAPNQ